VRDHILPDVLAPNLRVIFCGTAASNVSAKRQAYYAHPHNKFWSILSETRLTPRQLKPDEFMLMPGFGYGLTDVCKQASGTDSQIPRGTSVQRGELHEKILHYQPHFSPSRAWKPEDGIVDIALAWACRRCGLGEPGCASCPRHR
jgi:double-stranded uracil-DNA glycosylase